MKALIVFETAHGCTEKCAGILKGKLKFDTEIVRLRENPDPSLELYEVVIIGGSIHMGEINTRVRKFCVDNQSVLKTKILGLYICCMHEGEVALQQFEKSFDEDLRNHAKARGVFGGEFSLNKMNIFEKQIVKKLAGIEKSVSKIHTDEISLFAGKINDHFSSAS